MSVLIDAHVHLYPGFSLSAAFDAAWQNFSTASRLQPELGDADFAMALVEPGHLDVFESLRSGNLDDSTGEWSVARTNEDNSLVLSHSEKGRMFLICGRQWVTREDLEILALFDNSSIDSRKLTCEGVVDLIASNGGLPLLTWGVGKWTGARASVIESEIEREPLALLVGDNGNRPGFWKFPALLEKAVSQGIKLISGSDPLTLQSHQTRIGTRGSFTTDVSLNPENPASTLKNAMLDSDSRFEEFGSDRPVTAFFAEQVQMQWAKQRRKFAGRTSRKH
ncbi:MAG: hypothetical protein AAF402_13190 [Pseudomonadota bacterium]